MRAVQRGSAAIRRSADHITVLDLEHLADSAVVDAPEFRRVEGIAQDSDLVAWTELADASRPPAILVNRISWGHEGRGRR